MLLLLRTKLLPFGSVEHRHCRLLQDGASAWRVGDRGFELRSGIPVLKKRNVSSPLTREDSILLEPP